MDPQAGQPVQAVPVQNADAADAPPMAQVAPADIPAAPELTLTALESNAKQRDQAFTSHPNENFQWHR